MAALCSFYPSLTPAQLRAMPLDEFAAFVDYMNETRTAQREAAAG